MKPFNNNILPVILLLGLWWSFGAFAQQTNKAEKKTTSPKSTNNSGTNTPTKKTANSPTTSKPTGGAAAKNTTPKTTAVNPKKTAETQKAKTTTTSSKQATPTTTPKISRQPSVSKVGVAAVATAATQTTSTTTNNTTDSSATSPKTTANKIAPTSTTTLPSPLKGFGANMVQAGESSILQIMASTANSGQIDTSINGNYLFYFNEKPQSLLFTHGTATYVLAKDSVPARIFIAHTSPEGKKMEQMLQIKQGENGMPIPKNLPRWVALLPILLAFVLALMLREPIFSLFIAIFIGIWSLNGFAFSKILPSLISIFDRYLTTTLSNPNYISLLTATLLAGGMGALITHNGGINGLANGFSSMVSSPRGAQLTAWWIGVLVFFDQLAGIIVGGQVARPLTDRLRVSREKLAFLLNATTSSVAVLAVFGTFVGLALLPISDILKNAANPASPVSVWLFSLQYAFYPVWMLLFALCSALFLRDFGPMLRAEKRARFEGQLFESRIAEQTANAEYATIALPIGSKISRGYNALIPLLAFVVAAFVGVFYASFDKTLLDGTPTQVGTSILATAQQANPYKGLLWGSVAGILTAISLSVLGRWLSLRATVESILSGMKNVFPYITVLLLTLTLVQVCGELHTADYIATWFPTSPVAYIWLPIFAFGITALLLWALGSISTTVIFALPIMLTLAWQMSNSIGLTVPLGMALFYGTLASLIAGALFGSQISVIAQNTVISSLAADCPTTDHTQTQLPYAFLLAFLHLAATILCIFMPIPAWMVMIGGMVLLPLLLLIVGRKPKPIVEKQITPQNEELLNDTQNNHANPTAIIAGSTAAIIGEQQNNYSTTEIEQTNRNNNTVLSNDDDNDTTTLNNDDTLPYWKKEDMEEEENIDQSVLSIPDAKDNNKTDTRLYDTEPLSERPHNEELTPLITTTDNENTADISQYHKATFEADNPTIAEEKDTEKVFFTLNDRLKQWRNDNENHN